MEKGFFWMIVFKESVVMFIAFASCSIFTVVLTGCSLCLSMRTLTISGLYTVIVANAFSVVMSIDCVLIVTAVTLPISFTGLCAIAIEVKFIANKMKVVICLSLFI